MRKFCCDKFRFHYEGSSEMGLNFRIIKLNQAFIEKGYLGDNKYRYLITEGYSILDDKVKKIFIEFCPYCGKELKKFYRSDEYVNELNHEY
ncbi:MAG: hypothetical protein ABI675_31210 [Chitinophagaceae bacterium]